MSPQLNIQLMRGRRPPHRPYQTGINRIRTGTDLNRHNQGMTRYGADLTTQHLRLLIRRCIRAEVSDKLSAAIFFFNIPYCRFQLLKNGHPRSVRYTDIFLVVTENAAAPPFCPVFIGAGRVIIERNFINPVGPVAALDKSTEFVINRRQFHKDLYIDF